MECDKLRPISEAKPDMLILAYFDDSRPPEHRWCVMYYDDTAYLWRTRHGRDFIGAPTHFIDLGPMS